MVFALIWSESAGYYGAMTAVPPPTLKTALQQMVTVGLAQPGTWLTRASPQAADPPLASGDPRWQSELRPDLRRAAPEIYFNFRAEGVSNTREWVSREFAQMVNTDSYTEFWHLATEVDFSLDRCPSEEGKLSLLASDDTLEIQLRRLASKVHEMRTGDKDAALHMLAISLPGKKRDLASAWMVQDAQVHSKQNHQQYERVRKSVSRGGGDGASTRGKGTPHDKGGGKDQGKAGDRGGKDNKGKGRGDTAGRRGGRGGR